MAADTIDPEEAALDALLAAGDVDAIKSAVESDANEGRESDPNPGAAANDDAQKQAAAEAAAAEEAAREKAEAEAAAAKEVDHKSRREYISHLPTLRQEEIRIAAANPDLPLDQVSALAKASVEAASKGEPDEPSELETVEARLAEIKAELNSRDAKWERGNDYSDLQAERDRLLDSAQSLRLEKLIAERELNAQKQSFDEGWETSEALANKEFPDLADPTSDMFAAVAGRNEQITALMESGRPFPVIELDGDKVTLDPNNPKFPMLVAREQAIKLGKKAPEAKPGAKEASHAVKPRVISGVPASSGNVSVRDKADGDIEPGLKDRMASVADDAGLDEVLKGALNWKPRRAAFN